jgi:hypothetical protein
MKVESVKPDPFQSRKMPIVVGAHPKEAKDEKL